MTIALTSARRLQLLIGSDLQDWSDWVGNVTVEYSPLQLESGRGKIPYSVRLEIKPSWDNPESLDPVVNPTRFRVGQDVQLRPRNDANSAWLDCPWTHLKIVAIPSRPGTGSLFLDCGGKVLWSNQSKFDDDRSGIIYGQAETSDAVIQRWLEASDVDPTDISLPTLPESVDRPLGKRGQNSYLDQGAELAFANNYYLHQNASGQITATELSLASTSAIATVTRGQNDLRDGYIPIPDPERPAETTKVSGLGYELGTITNPSVNVVDETGNFNDLSPNSFGVGVFTRTITTKSFTTGANPTRTKRVQVFKAELLMFQDATIPSQLREASDEAITETFETGKADPTTARLTSCLRTLLENGRTIDPTDEVFNMRETERDAETITYGSGEPMTRYQLLSEQAEIKLDKNSANPWNKSTVEELDYNWTEHSTGKFDRVDTDKNPIIRLRSNLDREVVNPTALVSRTTEYDRDQPNKPFDTIYFDAGIDEDPTEFTGEANYMPPGGPSGYDKEKPYTVADGMAFRNEQMLTLAETIRDINIGRERGYAIELAINDALLQSPPLPEIDVTDTDVLTYTYKGDALTFEFTPTRATAGCVGIWIDGGYPTTLVIAGKIPQGQLNLTIQQSSFAIAGEIPQGQLNIDVVQSFVIAGQIPQGQLNIEVSPAFSIAGQLPQGQLNLTIQQALEIAGQLPQGQLNLNISSPLVIEGQIPQGQLILDISGPDPDAAAYISALGGTYTGTQEDAIDQFFVDLKADSTWSELDEIIIFKMQTEADALISLKTATSVATNLDSAVFTAGAGFTCDSAAGYIDTGYNPTSGSNWAQNSATAFYEVTSGAGTTTVKADLGCRVNSSNPAILCAVDTNSNRSYQIVNDTEVINSSYVGTVVGVHAYQRTASDLVTYYLNGASDDTYTGTSNGVPNLDIWVGAINENGSPNFRTSSRQYSIVAFGSSSVNITTITNAWNTLKAVL